MIKLLSVMTIIPLVFFNISFAKMKPVINKVKKSEPIKKVIPKFDRTTLKGQLLASFYHLGATKDSKRNLKTKVISAGGRAVPALVEVMKKDIYPDNARWLATLMLGRVMGKKSAAYIARFMEHPSWVLRMASLKTLLALNARDYGGYFAKLLKDKSFIVRHQALENIRLLGLTKFAPHVWSMLYDKKNYYQNKKSKAAKRTDIIKNVVTTVGDLKFDKAQEPLFKMIQKDRYADLFNEIEYSLEQITGKKSPRGTRQVKRIFWKKQSTASLIL